MKKMQKVTEINPLQDVVLMNNYLEKSNVNPVEELILTLEHQRNYETHVKFINLAKEMDEGGASLMRVPINQFILYLILLPLAYYLQIINNIIF